MENLPQYIDDTRYLLLSNMHGQYYITCKVRSNILAEIEHTHTHAPAHTHTHMHARTHTHMHARTHTHTHARTHARTHTHTHTHTCRYIEINSLIPTLCNHTDTDACIHAQPLMHARMHTDASMYICPHR